MDELPPYLLPGLTGRILSEPTALQTFFLPYTFYLHTFWWLAYIGTLTYMASRFVILPLLSTCFTSKASPKSRKKR